MVVTLPVKFLKLVALLELGPTSCSSFIPFCGVLVILIFLRINIRRRWVGMVTRVRGAEYVAAWQPGCQALFFGRHFFMN